MISHALHGPRSIRWIARLAVIGSLTLLACKNTSSTRTPTPHTDSPAPALSDEDHREQEQALIGEGPRQKIEGHILRTTQAMDYTGNSCVLAANTVFYFHSYIDETLGSVEFSLAEPISGCNFTHYFSVKSDDVRIIEQKPKDWQEGMDLETYIEQTYPDIDSTILRPSSHPQSPPSPRYNFPLTHKPLLPYTSGGRQFRAVRVSGGRLHAGVDLITASRSAIRAVADGTVLDYYYFYQGTYALVVDHGEFWVRYGEIAPHRRWANASKNKPSVNIGEVIGNAGMLHSGATMLHFEQYTGDLTGPLTVRWNYPFQRRKDLIDPTPFIQTLEKKQFP